ncbi:MAG TPA: glycosyltransferase family 2 protein, partial [Chthoniobacterales bacterium]|nr:glycosyltransferase family 2 protein [Chthoniobacterales bacterium]
PAALRSGFSLDVVVPWGRAMLVFEARSRDGAWEEVFTTRVRGPLLWARNGDRHEQVGNYAEWIRLYDQITRADVRAIRADISKLQRQPKFSVVVPVYNTDRRWLRRAIESVREQLYDNWELCIVDDASPEPRVWRLLQSYARRDPRIKIKRRAENGHISATSNDALALATGEFVALLDHDDELAATALYFAARELNHRPNTQLVYSDEDKLDTQGRRCDPYFKSDWNPDLFRSQNYVSHLSIYAAELVRKVGGFRTGFEGSQDYDLTLRCIEQIEPAQIRHIPHVLYHWRVAEQSTATFAGAKPYAHQAAVRAMQEHVDRQQTGARAVPHYANYLRVIYSPPADLRTVSIIIPTRDRGALLRQCVESIVTQTDYPNFDIIVVDNESGEQETLDYLQALRTSPRVTVLRAEGEFNFSRLNNIGAAAARGSFVALLNNDLEVMNRDWLREMVSHAARAEIGAVGARLWYPDGRMQHGGVILGVGGVATHAHNGIRKEHGYFARAHLTQNFSAVTGACMLLRKDVYLQLGGLDENNLAVAFNDVDFCLRLREAGLLVVWTPHAELVHHESASRGLEDTRSKQRRFLAEVDFMQKKWGAVLKADPFYNPNLSIESNQEFKLAFPPRVQKPWSQNPL